MKLIFRYLKPFALMLTLSVIFLLVQVFCDLGLPRLMSGMVDTGIQAGGIEPGAPEVISHDGMNLLQLFLDEQDAETLASGYSLMKAGSDIELIERYPASKQMDIYRLSNASDTQSEAIDNAYIRAVSTLITSLQDTSTIWASGDEVATVGEAPTADKATTLELERLYAMLPSLMEQGDSYKVAENSLVAGQELATMQDSATGDVSVAGAQVSITFTDLFYRELGADMEKLQREYIVDTGLKMLGVALLGGITAIFVGWFSSKIGTSVAARMRRDIFEKVGQFSSMEYDQFSTATLITRTTNDVQQIQQVILMGLRLILLGPIMGIGGIILAIRSSLSLSWIIAVAVISIVGLILVVFALVVPKFKILQKLVDKLNLVSRENLSGMMVIRAFGNEQYEEYRFEQANDHLRSTNRFVQRTMAFMFPAMMLIMNLIMLLIIWVGAKEIAESQLQLGNMMAFMQYATMIIMSFLLMSMMFMMIPRALVSAERIQEVLNTELTIRDPKNAKTLSLPEEITLEFKGVSFQYPNSEEPVLEGISFTAKPGQMTAFIGTTGSGKSTLVNLVPRFYDVTDGKILMNGVDIRELSQQELRTIIGYVPQKGVLFSGDIASNIRYGNEFGQENEMAEALEVAQAKDFVGKLEKGVSSPISQGGSNVSGGQRQRLAIARALIKKSPVYIFDDSFSALDLKTDAALRRALKPFTSNATVLVVAQRVTTIKDAQQIIVLDKGRIVGKGTHHELLDNCPAYRDIAESQLTKEELA